MDRSNQGPEPACSYLVSRGVGIRLRHLNLKQSPMFASEEGVDDGQTFDSLAVIQVFRIHAVTSER